MSEYDDLAGSIKAARVRRKWSQQELADAAGVSRGTIQNIEAGKPAHKSSIEAIMAVLDLNTSHAESPWSPDVAITLNVIGLFLEQLSPNERAAWVQKLTETIMGN